MAVRLAERRGVEFKRSIRVESLTPSEFRGALRAQYIELRTETYFEATERAIRLLGIVPGDFESDLLDMAVEATASNCLGLYSPTREAIVIPREVNHPVQQPATSEALRREILAHELQHAAQDCRWSIAALLGPSAPNQDVRLARSALLEGDAVCTAMDLMMADSGSSVLEFEGDIAAILREQLELGATLAAINTGVIGDSTTQLFEYGDGTALVQKILRADGWKGVDAALDDPPASSEQVLHPTKYLEQRDWPVSIAVELPTGLAEAGWEVAFGDSLGEFGLRELMGTTVKDEDLVRASFGWDGDRWILLRRGAEEALLWSSAWDSSIDARQAFTALSAIYELEGGGDAAWRASADRGAPPLLLRRHRDRVAMCIGLELDVSELETERGVAWGAVERALAAPLRYDEADEKRGRGDSRVTRRLEREAIAALEAMRIQVDGLEVTVRDLDLRLTLPGSQWTVETDTPMASVRVMFLRGDPTVNFNVNVTPTEGLGVAELLKVSLDYMNASFDGMEMESQSVVEDPRGPAMELRYSMDLGANRCWLQQLGFVRGDQLVVLTCTSVGEPIEGDVQEEFASILDSATFGDGPK